MAARWVDFRVYEELNDYLPPEMRKRTRRHFFERDLTVRQLLAVYRIPLDAVDLVLADGEPVGPDHEIRNGERIAAYPVFESFDIGSVARMRAHPLRRPRFALLGMEPLLRLLRLLGFDALPVGDSGPPAGAQSEPRILLYRAGALPAPRAAARRVAVAARKPRAQLFEILERLDLVRAAEPLSRCLSCNAVCARSEAVGGGFRLCCPECRREYPPGDGMRRRMLYAERVLRSGMPGP